MWQAEVRVDLDAIERNVRLLRGIASGAEVMAIVKGDGYGHGMVPAALAALRGGATWLGACTVGEALALRGAGVTAPVFAWLMAPGVALEPALEAGVDLGAGAVASLAEIVAAARRVGTTARVHLKLDTGLSRGGAVAEDWPVLCEAASKAQADGTVEVVGVWSHLIASDEPERALNDQQLAAFHDGLTVASRYDIRPRYRHLANSGAVLTRPDMHFDMVRPGIACYGLSPLPAERFGLRPAMTVRARVVQTKRVRGGQGVSYGHTYHTADDATLALVPIGYGDGVPRSASSRGRVRLAGANRRIAGRVCMDQFVLDCGDDPVAAGDVAVLFGPGDDGEPTADDWAAATETISYEVVTRWGSSRIPRVYSGQVS